MKSADSGAIQWAPISGHRSGPIEFKRLLCGRSGAPDNFELSLVRTGSDYFTPRHRHNFDQIRYCLEGAMNYSPGKDIPRGAVGYFPEGSPYGPQAEKSGTTLLLLQCGGASGAGFMSYQQLTAGFEALRSRGEFDRGTFAYKDESGTARRKDGYEAVWEYVNGRKVEYPAARFEEPIIMHPENFNWVPEAGSLGVARKMLGAFNERGTSIEFIRLDAGAFYRTGKPDAVELLYVTAGVLTAGAKALRAGSAIALDPSDDAVLSAHESSELFMLRMPSFN
jgi:hypothetical protein